MVSFDNARDDEHAVTLAAKIAQELPVAVWVGAVPDGETVFANAKFEALVRSRIAKSSTSLPRPHYFKRTGARYPEQELPFQRAVQTGATVTVDDLDILRDDGTRSHVRAIATPVLASDGKITHVSVVFIDMTAELSLIERRAEIENRLLEAQRFEAVGSLAGGVAHDFNNMLAAIKILAAQLRQHETDSSRLQMLQHIDQVTDNAVKLTRALLGFSRSGKAAPAPMSLNESVQTTADVIQRTFDKRIRVVCDLGARSGRMLGQAAQVEQVIMNLALNASDAIDGAGVITLRTHDLLVNGAMAARDSLPGPGPYVVLEVVDTGRGIEPRVRDHLFEPVPTTKSHDGSDTRSSRGLAAVREIVTSHRGAVDLADTGEGGTTMRVCFPSAPSDVPLARDHAGVPPRHDVQRGSGTILLVDDEPMVRGSAARALRTMGYHVITAEDGARAVEICRSQSTQIDAVLLDMMMPNAGGRDTYLAIRDIRRDLPVLLTTGGALDGEAEAIMRLGVRGFIAKPFDMVELSAAVAGVLAPRTQARP